MLSMVLFSYEDTGEIRTQHIDLETGSDLFLVTDLMNAKEVGFLKSLVGKSTLSEISFDDKERIGYSSPHVFNTPIGERNYSLSAEPCVTNLIRRMVTERARVLTDSYSQTYAPMHNIRETDSSFTLMMNVKDERTKMWGAHKFIFTEAGDEMQVGRTMFLVPHNSTVLDFEEVEVLNPDFRLEERNGKIDSWKMISIKKDTQIFPSQSIASGNFRAIAFLKMYHDVLQIFTSAVATDLFEEEESVQRPYERKPKVQRAYIKLQSNIKGNTQTVFLSEVTKVLRGENSLYMRKSFPFKIFLQLFKDFYSLKTRGERLEEYYRLMTEKSLLAISLFEYKTFNYYFDFEFFSEINISKTEFPGLQILLEIEGGAKRGI